MSKVLTAYATKYGATAEIAEVIGQEIQKAGFEVDVLAVDSVGDLAPYSAVVLGSAIYAGMWRREALEFLKSRETELAQRPVWIFSSGPTGEGDPVELVDGWQLPTAAQPIADRLSPRDIAVFHGNIDPDKINLLEKLMIRMVKAKAGDYRDWDAIRAWASGIAQTLSE